MSLQRSSRQILQAQARLCRTGPAISSPAFPRALSTSTASSSPLSIANPTSSRSRPTTPIFRHALSPRLVAEPHYQQRHNSYRLADAVGHKKLKEFDIEDGVYIVTGGGRGLGLCMAEALAEAGGKVYCLDRLEQPSPDFYEACTRIPQEFGGSLHYARVDVRDARSLDNVIGAVADAHQRLDGVVAAAGIQHLKAAVDYTLDEVREMMDINYSGVFMTCASSARAMFKWNSGVRDGAMVIIASMSGSVANKGLICPVYNSSKAALLQLTRNLAMEWSGAGREHRSGLGGIRVNSLSPGHILTPMVKRNFEEVPGLREKWERENMMGRLATPEEFKGAGLFLLSKASSFMTGSNLIIDGGHTAW